MNGVDQLVGAAKGAAPQAALGEQRELALDQVEPGQARGDEVQVKAGLPRRKCSAGMSPNTSIRRPAR